eukprot:NODE_7540_length_259_cov_304.742857_g6926_i0.p3 GENE.NODE_7540_length_259_cov_304.742857_g6926_i0~~NODE_7540_length_259_cov_304.742857_g6926_i0.p3  ORF type:complete len:81 (-),score=34.12 NODE_7540_length_259_cov_304.742857_g6926_i0:17-238(-)
MGECSDGDEDPSTMGYQALLADDGEDDGPAHPPAMEDGDAEASAAAPQDDGENPNPRPDDAGGDEDGGEAPDC